MDAYFFRSANIAFFSATFLRILLYYSSWVLKLNIFYIWVRRICFYFLFRSVFGGVSDGDSFWDGFLVGLAEFKGFFCWSWSSSYSSLINYTLNGFLGFFCFSYFIYIYYFCCYFILFTSSRVLPTLSCSFLYFKNELLIFYFACLFSIGFCSDFSIKYFFINNRVFYGILYSISVIACYNFYDSADSLIFELSKWEECPYRSVYELWYIIPLLKTWSLPPQSHKLSSAAKPCTPKLIPRSGSDNILTNFYDLKSS